MLGWSDFQWENNLGPGELLQHSSLCEWVLQPPAAGCVLQLSLGNGSSNSPPWNERTALSCLALKGSGCLFMSHRACQLGGLYSDTCFAVGLLHCTVLLVPSILVPQMEFDVLIGFLAFRHLQELFQPLSMLWPWLFIATS